MAKNFAYAFRTPGSRKGAGYCVRTAAEAKKALRTLGFQAKKGWAQGSSCADAKRKALKKAGTQHKKCKRFYDISHSSHWTNVPAGHWVIVERIKGSRKLRRVATRPKGKAAVAYVDRRNAGACR